MRVRSFALAITFPNSLETKRGSGNYNNRTCDDSDNATVMLQRLLGASVKERVPEIIH